MKEAKYTKTPLNYDKVGLGLFVIRNGNGQNVLYGEANNIEIEEAKANAKLFCGAKDLLEALEILINGFETGIVHGFENPCECQVCKAKKAIKKATE